mmetsp:Transcript_7926/g.24032  ORF Transcript_7926/g.24032 Transcript_7926/m.24032 type:complete len:233 (+) Transcript_7926:355-1053(+)
MMRGGPGTSLPCNCDHPHICRISEVYTGGGTLCQAIEPLPWLELVEFSRDMSRDPPGGHFCIPDQADAQRGCSCARPRNLPLGVERARLLVCEAIGSPGPIAPGAWKSIPPRARAFLSLCLSGDPHSRPSASDGDVPRALTPGASQAYVSEFLSEFDDGVVILDDCAGDSWKNAVGNGCQQEASSYNDCDGDNVRVSSLSHIHRARSEMRSAKRMCRWGDSRGCRRKPQLIS